ncbi:MAG: DUF424 family protein [Euryarchaeota archaeon]
MPRVSVNVQGTPDTLVIALCDEELLGRRLSAGDREIEVPESFYGGELMEVREAVRRVRRLADEYREEKTVAINALGERACSVVLEARLVSEGQIGELAGVPHVQVYILPREPAP